MVSGKPDDGSVACLNLASLELDDARIAGQYLPRTRTHALLTSLGLPVLQGCLVLDMTGLDAAAVQMAPYGAVLARSDPLRSDAPSIRGGDVWPLGRLRECAEKYLSLGRALILLEPYERTANQWSFAIARMRDHQFVLELVGPTFDTSHLNRGKLTPHELFHGEMFDGLRPSILFHQPFDRARYLADLVREQRPVPEAVPDGIGDELVTAILRNFRRVAREEHGEFVLSGAVVQPGERLIFWDLYHARQRNR